MQRVARFQDAAAEVTPEPAAAVPPSIEPIWSLVDSLSQTLECIKSMCETVPDGPARERLETERTNLVLGLFVARVAAMRLSSSEPAPKPPAKSFP
ncbi:MAG: hypothetical protein PS018_11195 [bacterium]|nr:hypothetical protein [bacterium]